MPGPAIEVRSLKDLPDGPLPPVVHEVVHADGWVAQYRVRGALPAPKPDLWGVAVLAFAGGLVAADLLEGPREGDDDDEA